MTSHARTRLLESFGINEDAVLGQGGEASVYALDEQRVLRLLHKPEDPSTLRARQALLDELARADVPFALPLIHEVGDFEGITFAVERRLVGRSMLDVLQEMEGAARDRLVEAHLEAAAALGDLCLESRGWYGDLIAGEPIRTATWREYLEARASWSLAHSTPALRVIEPHDLAEQLPEAEEPAFVHLDAFTGNMLVADGVITAVIDIGMTSAVGDRRLDPLSAAVYLESPEISGAVRARDVDVARSWLRARNLDDWFEPAQRWLAAYWACVKDSPALQSWCERILLA